MISKGLDGKKNIVYGEGKEKFVFYNKFSNKIYEEKSDEKILALPLQQPYHQNYGKTVQEYFLINQSKK